MQAKKTYFDPVTPSINFPELEEKILAFWKKEKIFEKSVENRPENKKWTFLDGPPFVTGLPHYGSLLSSLPKDVFGRYWTMKGYQVRRVWGWDGHGLPIENKVENKLGIKSKTSLFDTIFDSDIHLLQRENAQFYPENMNLYELLQEILVFGLLPGVWTKPKNERFDYVRSIVSLYLDKDIRAAGLVKELENFQHLLEILSYQVGSAWNLSHLSTQIQISVNTLRAHRSILKNTFVLNFVYPYSKSPQKGVVKSPKCYFYDIGVANYLAGRERIENIFDSKSSGGIFENIIIKSFEAWNSNQTIACKTYFWRNYEDREIDYLIEKRSP